MLSIIYSCTPRIISNEEIFSKDNNPKSAPKKEKTSISKEQSANNLIIQSNAIDNDILSEIEIILPINKNKSITENFINSLELSLYKKNINNLSFNINTYYEKKDLDEIVRKKIKPGKIFIGPLTSSDTLEMHKYCSEGVIFFSFASNRELASDCIFLINFFPEDDLQALLNYFDSKTRLALLYPENHYGNYISKIIDIYSVNSKAIIVNKVSYFEDMSNARSAIKKLGKYDLRKQELERQKKILKNKNDEISIKALKKIEKFETIGDLDFTHVIIADYNIRLLEIAPLLPFYDIDPNKIQFVGTGVWDDEAFFYEPSLQNAIFPGVSVEKRDDFTKEYISFYKAEPIRTFTIMHDLVGLLDYIIKKQSTTFSVFDLLNNKNLSFEGIDGKFSFEGNLIKRDLKILKIKNGNAILIN